MGQRPTASRAAPGAETGALPSPFGRQMRSCYHEFRMPFAVTTTEKRILSLLALLIILGLIGMAWG